MKRRPSCTKTAVLLAIMSLHLLMWPEFAKANPLSGDYYGSVAVSSPAGLGSIDLAFHLELDGSGEIKPAKSYIPLEKTLLFPKSGKVGKKDVGPKVKSGHLRSEGFELTTQRFATDAAGRTVTRQISLKSGVISMAGNSISGTYTETMTGYLPNSTKVVGKFVLVRPIAVTEGFPCCQDSMKPAGELTIREIRAGGKDPTAVEFEDVNCAMRYYRGLASGLTVSPATMGSAIDEYQKYLKAQP